MTSYEKVANFKTDPIFPSDHIPIYVRYIGRHGSRYPNQKDMRRIKTMHETVFKDMKDPLHISRLREFSNESYHHQLSSKGRQELFDIGTRYRKRLFSSSEMDNYNFGFKFESTCTSRTVESMDYFMDGFFTNVSREKTRVQKREIPCVNDSLYRFFDTCSKYKKFHDCLNRTEKDIETFFSSQKITKITEKFNEKLGLKHNSYLDNKDLKSLYVFCAYQILMYNISRNDFPCNYFDNESFEAFEHLQDIKHFQRKTNLYDINIKIATPLLKNSYDSIINAVESCENPQNKNNKNISGDFGFAHAETIFPLLGLMGVVDVKNIYHNYASYVESKSNTPKQNEKFSSAYISPMAANLMFVVACSTQKRQGVIKVLLNENPIQIPCCMNSNSEKSDSNSECTKEQFKACFEESANYLNFESYCKSVEECSQIIKSETD